MIDRILLATLVVSASMLAAPSGASANVCGTGFVEKLDRQGEPFCVAVAKERTTLLEQQQLLRRKQREWRAALIRDRQETRRRQAEIEQRRRDRALN